MFFVAAVLASFAPVEESLTAAKPCDIYDAAGTPCVAAHSMVRALYGAYDGDLYLIKRKSDNATKAIVYELTLELDYESSIV